MVQIRNMKHMTPYKKHTEFFFIRIFGEKDDNISQYIISFCDPCHDMYHITKILLIHTSFFVCMTF